MLEILTSKANRAVMAVTIERGFLPLVCSARCPERAAAQKDAVADT
jgi:hypothetical protein